MHYLVRNFFKHLVLGALVLGKHLRLVGGCIKLVYSDILEASLLWPLVQGVVHEHCVVANIVWKSELGVELRVEHNAVKTSQLVSLQSFGQLRRKDPDKLVRYYYSGAGLPANA